MRLGQSAEELLAGFSVAEFKKPGYVFIIYDRYNEPMHTCDGNTLAEIAELFEDYFGAATGRFSFYLSTPAELKPALTPYFWRPNAQIEMHLSEPIGELKHFIGILSLLKISAEAITKEFADMRNMIGDPQAFLCSSRTFEPGAIFTDKRKPIEAQDLGRAGQCVFQTKKDPTTGMVAGTLTIEAEVEACIDPAGSLIIKSEV